MQVFFDLPCTLGFVLIKQKSSDNIEKRKLEKRLQIIIARATVSRRALYTFNIRVITSAYIHKKTELILEICKSDLFIRGYNGVRRAILLLLFCKSFCWMKARPY